MATFRVPQQSHNEGPGSAAQPGGLRLEPDTRRGSLSTTGADSANAAGPPHPPPSSDMEMQRTGGAAGPAAGAAAGAAANKGTHRKTYLERHPEERVEGWSRGRKICCGLTLLFLAILIVIGILVAFMVRVPTISYDRSEIICPNNDYVKCAQDQIQVKVWLNVDNPNILGATINAELGLYKQDGTFLGPGTVDDTSISKRGTTEVMALFNITSGRGYDILQKLFLPPQSSVTVDVKGTVYIHVGLIKPSVQFHDSFTIPPQSIASVLGGIDLPSLPDTSNIPSIPGLPLSTVAVPVATPTTAPTPTPTQWVGVVQKREGVNPHMFARALVMVGAPQSATRKQFEQHTNKETLAQKVAKQMYAHKHVRTSVDEQLKRL